MIFFLVNEKNYAPPPPPPNNYLGLRNCLSIFKEHILGSDLQVRTFQII